MKPATLTDAELLEALELAAARARMAAAGDLRAVGDVLAGLALEAGARIRAGKCRDVLRSAPGPLVGRARNVVIHGDGRLTCELEIADGAAGARFLEQIGGRS